MKTSMVHIKYLTPQFLGKNEKINIINNINLALTFLCLNFLSTGLCNTSFAFTLALLLVPVSAFLTKSLYTKLVNSLNINHI